MIRQSNFETSDGQILCIFISDWWRYLIRGGDELSKNDCVAEGDESYGGCVWQSESCLLLNCRRFRRKYAGLLYLFLLILLKGLAGIRIMFMTVARGSATELETQLMICEMLNYLDSNDVVPLLKMLDEIRRMLSALIKNGRAD